MSSSQVQNQSGPKLSGLEVIWSNGEIDENDIELADILLRIYRALREDREAINKLLRKEGIKNEGEVVRRAFELDVLLATEDAVASLFRAWVLNCEDRHYVIEGFVRKKDNLYGFVISGDRITMKKYKAVSELIARHE